MDPEARARKLLQESVPRGFRAERNEALHRILTKLPDHLLRALIDGFERADVIEPGRLFAGVRGGCAVGVVLRALDPSYEGRRFWRGRHSRRSVCRLRKDLAREMPYLTALEQVFDRSVAIARERNPWAPKRWLSRRVAAWIADEARTELLLREMSAQWGARAGAGPRSRFRRQGAPAWSAPAPAPAA